MLKTLFQKYKTAILRVIGVVLVLSALGTHYYMPPREMSENEKAAMRVARMEGQSSQRVVSTQSSRQSYMNQYQEYQAKQIEYFTFIFTLLGLGFFIASFMKKES